MTLSVGGGSGWELSWKPKWRFMNVLKEDVKVVGVREEDAEGRLRWR